MSTTPVYDEAAELCQFPDLLQRSVRDLANVLAEETRKYQRHQPYNDQAGMALFTLAILYQNQEAWAALYEHYKPLVYSWVMQHPLATRIVARDGEATPLINGVFAKFFQAVPPAKFQRFNSLAALLKYLRFCARSVVCDEVRLYRTRHTETMVEEIENEPAEDDPADDVLATLQAHHVWQIILEELPSTSERLLLYQMFWLNMKPSEVSQYAPGIFPTAEDVYRVKRNVLERLRRSKRLAGVVSAG